MSSRCPTCSRVNPPEARYCYADGTALANGQAERTDAARLHFPFPFIFPSGRTCHSFDELALACLDEWEVARSLLQHGDLASYQAQARWAQTTLQRSSELAQHQYEARETVDQKQSQLDQARAGIVKTEALIEQKLIRAPFSGQLGMRQIEVCQ